MSHNCDLYRNQAMPQPSLDRERPLAARRPILCLAMLCCLIGLPAISSAGALAKEEVLAKEGGGAAAAFDQQQVYQLKPKDSIMFFGDSTTVEGMMVAGHVKLVIQAVEEQIPDQGVKINAICRGAQTSGRLVGGRSWIPQLKEVEIKETTPKLTFTINQHTWIAGEVIPIEQAEVKTVEQKELESVTLP